MAQGKFFLNKRFLNKKGVSQFLEGLTFLSYTLSIVSFELVFKDIVFRSVVQNLVPLLSIKTSTACRALNKGFLKKNGLSYPYVSLLKKFVQVQYNVPFGRSFFLNTFYTKVSDRKGIVVVMHHNFLFKKALINIFNFDFFRAVLLSKLYKLNQFVYSNISELGGGFLFRFKFHEVLLRSFFISRMLDEKVDQQAHSFKFFQFLEDFNVLNEPLSLDLFFQHRMVDSVFENKRLFIQFLSFFGFFFSKQFSKQFSNKFFIKLI